MKKTTKSIEEVKNILKEHKEEFKTIMEASNFWDTHDITDYWDDTKEVNFKIS
jgi:hypothetical protein